MASSSFSAGSSYEKSYKELSISISIPTVGIGLLYSIPVRYNFFHIEMFGACSFANYFEFGHIVLSFDHDRIEDSPYRVMEEEYDNIGGPALLFGVGPTIFFKRVLFGCNYSCKLDIDKFDYAFKRIDMHTDSIIEEGTENNKTIIRFYPFNFGVFTGYHYKRFDIRVHLDYDESNWNGATMGFTVQYALTRGKSTKNKNADCIDYSSRVSLFDLIWKKVKEKNE